GQNNLNTRHTGHVSLALHCATRVAVADRFLFSICHVDLPLLATVISSAVNVVVCRWCGKMGDLTEFQRGMIAVPHLVEASVATVANVVGVSIGTMSNVMREYSTHG
ncbi:hypothetical protein C0J52_21055, partial [Blattella germanica]